MGTSCLQHAPHPARQEMRRPAFVSRSMAWSSNCRLNSNSEGNSSRSVIGRDGTATAKSSNLPSSLSVKLAVIVSGIVVQGHPAIRSEEHTSELQSLMRISYAVFCLKKKKTQNRT